MSPDGINDEESRQTGPSHELPSTDSESAPALASLDDPSKLEANKGENDARKRRHETAAVVWRILVVMK